MFTQDSYGRGPITRELTALRGEVHSGNSGGPLVDGNGQVMGTVFAATTQGKPGGYAVPNDVVAARPERLERARRYGAVHSLNGREAPTAPPDSGLAGPYDR